MDVKMSVTSCNLSPHQACVDVNMNLVSADCSVAAADELSLTSATSTPGEGALQITNLLLTFQVQGRT